MPEDRQIVRAHIERQQRFQFSVDFPDNPQAATITVDERPPLGEDAGPNPAGLLAAALGSCLSASFLFCLKKARLEPTDVSADVTATIVRNERGRFRIGEVEVQLSYDAGEMGEAGVERCKGIFEDFCIVTESVRHGIPVRVQVAPARQDLAQETHTA